MIASPLNVVLAASSRLSQCWQMIKSFLHNTKNKLKKRNEKALPKRIKVTEVMN
jgi:hypothetical protein